MDLFVARFLALDRVPKILPSNIGMSVESQIDLLTKTLHRNTVKRFPLPRDHVLSLLESIVRSCERSEVADEVYDLLANYLRGTRNESSSFGIFSIGNRDLIFQVYGNSSALVQNGSTGFITWEAGKCLCWYVSNQLKTSLGNRFLELGCGTGVTGMVIVSSVPGCEYTFTDYHEATLKQAQHNCNLNDISSTACFKRLDLLDPQSHAETDVILAADILYSEELCRGLVGFLANSSTKFKAAFIMTTIRTESTYNVFLEALRGRENLSSYSIRRARMSEWIESTEPGSDWRHFLDSSSLLFDPEIELVRIVKM